MNPGDVVLIPVPQLGGGEPKLRLALLLANLPGPYQNLLLCDISTQLANLQPKRSRADPLPQPSNRTVITETGLDI